MILAEPIRVTLEIVAALDDLKIEYFVGGSLASSMHGIPRSTNDLDLVVVLPGRLVDPLVQLPGPRFYVDADRIRDAILRCASFNIVHLETMFKVDLFVFDRSEMARAELKRRQSIELGDSARAVWVCSPEDIVLQKLDWYQKGNRVSDRQWADLQGVLTVQGSRLDFEYLQGWASKLGLHELLERALHEAGLG